MKRAIAVIGLSMTLFVAACTPDDGTGSSPEPGLESPATEFSPEVSPEMSPEASLEVSPETSPSP